MMDGFVLDDVVQQTLSVTKQVHVVREAHRSRSSDVRLGVTHVPVDVDDGLLQRHREEDGRHRVTLFHARAHPPDEPMY